MEEKQTRKLASVQRILKIEKHSNADTLDIASVLGWRSIVRKGDFVENQLIVYIEIDSLIPISTEFEFLRKSSYRKFADGSEAFRLKTMKLRGEISQGLIVPLSILAGKKWQSDTRENPIYNFQEGDDVTSLLGITKYEPAIPAQLSGEVKGLFPNFLSKTDETRVQLLQEQLNKYQGTDCIVTEKIDGSSITIYLNKHEFGVCSRNLELKENDNTIWKLVRELNIEENLRRLLNGAVHDTWDMALQGEIYGEGIQSNPLKIKGHRIAFFNAFNINTGKYFDSIELLRILNLLKLDMVPIVTPFYTLINNIPELEKFAVGNSVINKDVMREGIVIRPLKEIYDVDMKGLTPMNRLSFKVINKEYLLKNEDA